MVVFCKYFECLTVIGSYRILVSNSDIFFTLFTPSVFLGAVSSCGVKV